LKRINGLTASQTMTHGPAKTYPLTHTTGFSQDEQHQFNNESSDEEDL
jgi:hypothetical protein